MRVVRVCAGFSKVGDTPGEKRRTEVGVGVSVMRTMTSCPPSNRPLNRAGPAEHEEELQLDAQGQLETSRRKASKTHRLACRVGAVGP